MRIAICEDEQSFAVLLKEKIEDFCAGKGCVAEISVFSDGESFLASVLKDERYDAVFMDIHLGGDEVPLLRWRKCPDCQKRMAEEGMKETANKLIHIGKPIEMDYEAFISDLMEFKDMCDEDIVDESFIRTVKKLVPTYVTKEKVRV